MNIAKETSETIGGAGEVLSKSAWSIAKDPQILLYPVLAFLVSGFIFSLISKTIIADWYNQLFNEVGVVVPNRAHLILGIVTLSAFIAAIISSYFTCAVSASVLARLEGHPTKPLGGLVQVFKHFDRVSVFALLAVFMFPVGVFSQLRKLPRKWAEVFGSSFALNMAQLSPEILHTKKSFAATVVDTIAILGKKWKVGLVLKIGMYTAIVVVFVLPKLIQSGFFSQPSANKVGWAISIVVATSSFAFFKVLSAIFTTVLYHQAKSSK